MDVERDSSSHQRQSASSGGGHTVQDDTVKSMKERIGTGLSLGKMYELSLNSRFCSQ